MEEKISIIVPVYNSEPYLDLCVTSLLSQQYQHTEIILVNDGSRDASLDICRRYQKADPRIVVIDQKNAGVSAARNAGIAAATGEFIMFCDSDDCVRQDWCTSMRNVFCPNYLVMCAFQEVLSDEIDNLSLDSRSGTDFHPESVDKKQFLYYRDRGIGSPTTKLFERNIIVSHQIRFPESLALGEDLAFVLEYLNHISGNILYLNEPLYAYRMTGLDSLSRRAPTAEQCGIFGATLKRAMERLEINDSEEWTLMRKVVMYDYEKAIRSIGCNEKMGLLAKRKKIKEIMDQPVYRDCCQAGKITSNPVYRLAFEKRLPFLLTMLLLFQK